jgi:hypothetical protein
LISPALRPWLSVVIMVWAATGCTARAKPLASAVTTNSRRVKPTEGTRLSNSGLVRSGMASLRYWLLGIG